MYALIKWIFSPENNEINDFHNKIKETKQNEWVGIKILDHTSGDWKTGFFKSLFYICSNKIYATSNDISVYFWTD